MSKYINANSLKLEVENYIKEVKDAGRRFTPNMGFFDAKLSGINDVMAIIDSLHPEPPEGDLDKEIDNYFYHKNFKRVNDGVEIPGMHLRDWKNPNVDNRLYTDDLRRFARHFYELGRSCAL